ncbi:MAG: flagellar hook-length control protein FliK [Alphaproteobacteria bacterium]|nr:flagellar hook-length control protein FliK [Alphaproteobacteria bacterium]
MSDTVTNPVGNTEPRNNAAAGFQNAKVTLSNLFADVLNETRFTDQMLPRSDFGLARAAERDFEVGRDVHSDDQGRVDAEPTDTEVRGDDDRPQDGDETATKTQADEQPQDDGAAETQQFDAATADKALLVLNAAANDAQKIGLTIQPNAASGAQLQSKTEGTTAENARDVLTRGEIQAAARNTANAEKAQALGQEATARANAALGNNQVNANGVKTDVAEPKTGPVVDTVANDKTQLSKATVLNPSQGTTNGDSEGLTAALEKYSLLIRAGAKRAAELHYMKIRVMAHRDAIKNAISQSTASTQAQTTAPGANKPSIEITTSATPPAPAAFDGPAARPVALFNSTSPGTLPGQAGTTRSANMAIGDAIGNGVGQSTAAADRQVMTANATGGLNMRPLPAQPAYQPAEQVKVQIQQMVKSDADRIQVKLSPASLGRVEVILEMGPDKAVQAIVYAEKQETLDMLERDARVLQKAFEEAGMKFDSDGLMFKQGQSGDADTELADGSTASGTVASADGDDLDPGDATYNERPSRRQHDGMLDLEI